MTNQEKIKAVNKKEAIKIFLKRNPNLKIYDVTRTFASYNENKNERVYRVTGINKDYQDKKQRSVLK